MLLYLIHFLLVYNHKLVVSWVFAKDDFFKTSDSLSAPFVDLSVPVMVSKDESLVVSVVLLVDFVDVELVVEVTSINLFCE